MGLTAPEAHGGPCSGIRHPLHLALSRWPRPSLVEGASALRSLCSCSLELVFCIFQDSGMGPGGQKNAGHWGGFVPSPTDMCPLSSNHTCAPSPRCKEILASPSPSLHISLDKLDFRGEHRKKEMIMRTRDLPISTSIKAKIEAWV